MQTELMIHTINTVDSLRRAAPNLADPHGLAAAFRPIADIDRAELVQTDSRFDCTAQDFNLTLYRMKIVYDHHAKQGERMTMTNRDRARRACFAIADKLPFSDSGLNKDQLWQWVLEQFNVKSRSDLTEQNWVQLEARLRAAEQNPPIFKGLVTQLRLRFYPPF